MTDFIYGVGMVTAADSDPDRAYLRAFGLNLKLKRVARGLSQDEFGELIGLHRTFVGQLERGRRGLNIVRLPGIAAALGVTQADLLPEPAPED